VIFKLEKFRTDLTKKQLKNALLDTNLLPCTYYLVYDEGDMSMIQINSEYDVIYKSTHSTTVYPMVLEHFLDLTSAKYFYFIREYP